VAHLGSGTCTGPPAGPGQDAQALLVLKAALLDPAAPAAAQAFATWDASVAPCGGQPSCAACRLDHPACGAFGAGQNATLCAWRFVQCAGGRVTGLLLDMQEALPPGSPPPAAPWPVFSFSALPPELGGASALQQLLLGSHVAVGGGLPASWSALGQLRQLSVRLELGASGTLPAEWSAWGQVASVSIAAGSASALQGTLPAQWSAWGPSLRRLALLGGGYVGTLPGAWSALSQLQSLALASLPGLGGGVPPSWQAPGAMPALAAVSVAAVPLFAANSSSLSSYYGWLSAKPLAALELAGQGLAGAPDPALPAMFPALADLLLSGNPAMSGSIPPEWYAFNAMRRLELAGSGLSGTLPAWLWATLADGATLDLASNSLTGARRSSSCAAPAKGAAAAAAAAPPCAATGSLQKGRGPLSLQKPALLPAPPAPTGTLPPEWANISFSLLNLAGNQLQGTVPPSWAAIAYGSPRVLLDRNNLRGPLPPSFANTTGLLGGQPSRLLQLGLR
jgi:hypothetical protein